MTYALYARKGWGSAITEAMLAYAHLDHELRDPKGNLAKKIPPLKQLNPLEQFPTLVCPDGHIMTESAAILFHIDDVAPDSGLVPNGSANERRDFLRLLQIIVCTIYPTFTYADFPERYVSSKQAQDELVKSSKEKRNELWLQVEGLIDPNPHLLGSRFTGLDIYAAAMTHWGPGRRWFAEHCPKLMSAAKSAETIDTLRPVLERNFKP